MELIDRRATPLISIHKTFSHLMITDHSENKTIYQKITYIVTSLRKNIHYYTIASTSSTPYGVPIIYDYVEELIDRRATPLISIHKTFSHLMITDHSENKTIYQKITYIVTSLRKNIHYYTIASTSSTPYGVPIIYDYVEEQLSRCNHM